MKKLRALPLLAALSAPVLALPQTAAGVPPGGPALPGARRSVAVFLGPDAGFGEIRIYDEATGVERAAPAELGGLALLDLDFVGRSDLDSLLEDRAQRRPFGNVSRIVLPRERGSIYHFERSLPGGARRFGFLWARPDGVVRIFGERDGAGAVGSDNPWMARIAVGPDGRGVLAATREFAGGDLFRFELADGSEANLTLALPPRAFSPAGLWLHADWGLAAGPDGVLRFERGAAAARPVPFGAPAPTFFSGEVAISKNRAFAITSAGDSASALGVYVLGAGGPALLASSDLAPVTPAGYLPEHPLGPYMAVANDGTCAAWRVALDAREVFFGRVEPAPAPVQITDDGFFDDTMNEVGLIGFYEPGRLRMNVGERDTGDPLDFLEGTDVYEATLEATTGTPVVENLTRTSGDAQAPFLFLGTIEPKGMRWVPEARRLLVHDGADERLLSVDPNQPGPARVLLDDVKDLDWVERVGRELAVAVRRDADPRPRQVHRLSADLVTPAALLTGGPDDATRFLMPTPSSDGWLCFVRREPAVADRLQRVFVPGGTLVTLNLGGAVTTPLGSSPGGATLFAMQPGGGANTSLEWTLAGATRRLRTPPGIPARALPAR